MAHIGLEVRSQYSVISHQCQLFSPFSPQKRRLISRDNYAHRHEWENYDRVLGEGSLGQFDLIILDYRQLFAPLDEAKKIDQSVGFRR